MTAYWTGANRRLIEQLAETSRKAGMSTRSGYITDIKSAENGEQKVRVCWGKGPDGKEVKSPWLPTTNQRGEGRERQAFKKGQNMRIQAPNGDFRQAQVTPSAEGDSTPAPDHAHDAGEKAVTSQNGKTRTTHGQSSSTMWIAEEDNKPPEHKAQPSEPMKQGSGGGSGGSGGSGSSGSQEESKPKKSDPGKPSSVYRLTGDQVMGRHKDGARFAAHKEGAKLKKKDDFVYVKDNEIHVQTKKPSVSRPWIIQTKKDPIPDDDDIKDKDEGGGQGGGSGGGQGAQA